jgi:RNA polymerase-binding protein DksA
MTRLTPEQISHLTGLMDERFAREMEEISAVAARSRDERRQEILAGRPADHVDAALAEIALAADYAVVRQDVEDVRDIIAARKRLSAGEYGICTDCGEEIAYERLLAYPTAKRCIDCQRLYEQQKAAREGWHAP